MEENAKPTLPLWGLESKYFLVDKMPYACKSPKWDMRIGLKAIIYCGNKCDPRHTFHIEILTHIN
jgi:hypothetical protein